jgi:flagellar basal-body rod protein FlgG
LLSAAGRDGALDVVDEPSLRPGWLDGSAADPMQELVRLVEAQRAFESYQKIVKMTMNEVNRRAVNEIAAQ